MSGAIRRHKGKVGVLTVLLALVPVGIEVDKWLMERHQMTAQRAFAKAVQVCEDMGGRWLKGDCIHP